MTRNDDIYLSFAAVNCCKRTMIHTEYLKVIAFIEYNKIIRWMTILLMLLIIFFFLWVGGRQGIPWPALQVDCWVEVEVERTRFGFTRGNISPEKGCERKTSTDKVATSKAEYITTIFSRIVSNSSPKRENEREKKNNMQTCRCDVKIGHDPQTCAGKQIVPSVFCENLGPVFLSEKQNEEGL